MSAAQYWTLARIRKATPFPKPKGAVATVMAGLQGHDDPSGHIALLRHIAKYGDLIDQPIVVDPGGYGSPLAQGKWLLVPLSLDMLDALAEFEAHLADLEPDHDRELEDDEPSLGAPERFSQKQWAQNQAYGGHDLEADPAEAGEDETDGHDLPYEQGRGLKLPVYEAAD